MNILILGGTRFLGPALVETALEQGFEVTLFNRGRTDPEMFPELEQLRGDRDHDVSALAGRRFDAVIDTSGHTPLHVRTVAAELAEGIGQYLFVPSLSVLADERTPGLTEDAETLDFGEADRERAEQMTMEDADGDLYRPLKMRSERAAEEEMPGRVTIVRPGRMVGPGDASHSFHYWPWRTHEGGEILAPRPEDGAIQLIDVRDVARFCLRLIADGHSGVFHATGPAYPLTMAAVIFGAKSVTGTVGEVIWVNEPFLLERGLRAGLIPLWTPASDDGRQGLELRDVSKGLTHGLTFRPLADTCVAVLDDLYRRRDDDWETRFEAISRREREILDAWRERNR